MAKWIVTAIAIVLLGGLAWVVWHLDSSERGEVFDEWEKANTTFKVRIRAHKEMAAFTPGAFYVLQSSSLDSESWKEIITIRTDEAHPIPRDRIRFVSDNVGYVFLSSYYAATTDGGSTWLLWNGDKNIPNGRELNLSPAPKAVDLQPNGTGIMVLYPFVQDRKQGPDLYTTDYGRHWNIK
jgi:hypothetical protein